MSIYDIKTVRNDGEEISLKEYEWKVLLIINSATGCGVTPQYDDLQDMYKELHDEGFEILYFPCNQFANQASGSDEEIASFCSRRFGITFPLFKKLEVKKYISRTKDEKDDRNLIIRLEPKGLELREKALTIPKK